MTAEARDQFYQPQRERLEHMAFRAIKKGLKPDEFVTVAIDVDDPNWKEVVEVLMPNATEAQWQEFRDRGETPVARGTAMADGLLEYLSMVCPDIAPVLMDNLPPEGFVRAIIMTDGGASVYYIKPFPHFKDS